MSQPMIFSPISGGSFVAQTAILATIMPILTVKPAYFGNSGGAIANLIASKYSGTSESMERILYSIDKEIFIRPWVSSNMYLSKVLSPLVSLFSSSFYKDSVGPKTLMETFYSENELKKTEMWIGKFDIEANVTHLLCTRTDGTSIFNTEIKKKKQIKYLNDMTGTVKVEYAGGDIDVISKTLNATSSIPGYKPPIEIDEILFVDGGVGAPSPGSSFPNILLDYGATNTSTKHQFFYVIGPKLIDSEKEYIDTAKHWSTQLMRTLSSLMSFSIYRERSSMFDTWVKMTGKSFYGEEISYKEITGRDEIKLELESLSTRHYFVTCYTVNKKINIINFEKEDLKRVYKECYDSTFYEIFYI
jgi:hypothetical protein